QVAHRARHRRSDRRAAARLQGDRLLDRARQRPEAERRLRRRPRAPDRPLQAPLVRRAEEQGALGEIQGQAALRSRDRRHGQGGGRGARYAVGTAMDPALEELNEAGPPDEEVSLILRLQDGAEPPPTVRIVSRFGPIITVRCRRADIRPTWESDRVISTKAPRAVHLPRQIGERRAPAAREEAEATGLAPEDAEALAEGGPAR